jgi:hypothetical protein
LAIGVAPVHGEGCLISAQPLVIRQDAKDAHVIVTAWLVQNRLGADMLEGDSTFQIIDSIREHRDWKPGPRFTINRHVPLHADKPPQAMLMFADIHKGKIDFYRGIQVADPKVTADYLRSLLSIPEEDFSRRLAYCFKHFDSAEPEVVQDAFREMSLAEPGELIRAGKGVDADLVKKKLLSATTPARQLGVLALLLAGCGKCDDVQVIRKLLDQIEGRPLAGLPQGHQAVGMSLDPALIAFAVMAPELGFAELRSTIANPKRTFMHRYGALRAARYLWENPIKPIDRAAVAHAIATLLDQEDIADLGVDDLRRFERWDFADQVLALPEKFEPAIIQRAVLRFTLAIPKPHKKAEAYLNFMRAVNREAVEAAEETLKLEDRPTRKSPNSGK